MRPAVESADGARSVGRDLAGNRLHSGSGSGRGRADTTLGLAERDRLTCDRAFHKPVPVRGRAPEPGRLLVPSSCYEIHHWRRFRFVSGRLHHVPAGHLAAGPGRSDQLRVSAARLRNDRHASSARDASRWTAFLRPRAETLAPGGRRPGIAGRSLIRVRSGEPIEPRRAFRDPRGGCRVRHGQDSYRPKISRVWRREWSVPRRLRRGFRVFLESSIARAASGRLAPRHWIWRRH